LILTLYRLTKDFLRVRLAKEATMKRLCVLTAVLYLGGMLAGVTTAVPAAAQVVVDAD
jgi:hypothetical protein